MNVYSIRDRDGNMLYTFGWNEPLTDEQIYRLFRAMGFRVAWAPWWKRAWWRLRVIARRCRC